VMAPQAPWDRALSTSRLSAESCHHFIPVAASQHR
jgi:hypothetical protein